MQYRSPLITAVPVIIRAIHSVVAGCNLSLRWGCTGIKSQIDYFKRVAVRILEISTGTLNHPVPAILFVIDLYAARPEFGRVSVPRFAGRGDRKHRTGVGRANRCASSPRQLAADPGWSGRCARQCQRPKCRRDYATCNVLLRYRDSIVRPRLSDLIGCGQARKPYRQSARIA
jgi:hypothetical protein